MFQAEVAKLQNNILNNDVKSFGIEVIYLSRKYTSKQLREYFHDCLVEHRSVHVAAI